MIVKVTMPPTITTDQIRIMSRTGYSSLSIPCGFDSTP
jgi:hypothetical protein